MLEFLFINDDFPDYGDEVGQQGQKPEEGAGFGEFFRVLLDDLEFGQYVEVVVDPVHAEEGSC